jgi:hypothetical protein
MPFDYKRWKEQQCNTTTDTPRDRVECPTTIYVIGMLWIAVGIIFLACLPLLTLKLGKFNSILSLFPFGLIYVIFGIQTLTGAAASTVRSGIFSAFYGIVWTLSARMLAVTSTKAVMSGRALSSSNASLILFFVALVGVALFLAGCLAIIYSGNYQRWRNSQ